MNSQDSRGEQVHEPDPQQLTLATSIQLTQFLLRDMIQSQLEQCNSQQQGLCSPSMFNSQQIPPISLQAYLYRLHKYTQYSPQSLIIALIYLDRYNMSSPEFTLTWYNVHRILLTCLILAVKFNDDVYFDNLAYEKGGGVPISQIGEFQLELFAKMKWNCFVDHEEWYGLLQKLVGVYSQQDNKQQNSEEHTDMNKEQAMDNEDREQVGQF